MVKQPLILNTLMDFVYFEEIGTESEYNDFENIPNVDGTVDKFIYTLIPEFGYLITFYFALDQLVVVKEFDFGMPEKKYFPYENYESINELMEKMENLYN